MTAANRLVLISTPSANETGSAAKIAQPLTPANTRFVAEYGANIGDTLAAAGQIGSLGDDHFNHSKAREIGHVERQQPVFAMREHGGDNVGVVYLTAAKGKARAQ
jgi:hypothetical protein